MTEGQALDQQFLMFSKALLNQYKLFLAGTFYSWGCWGGLKSWFSSLCAPLKSKTDDEGAGEGTRAFLVTNGGDEKLGPKSAGSLLFPSPEHQ